MKKKSILFLILCISGFQVIAQSSLLVTDLSNGQVTIQNNSYIFLTTASGSSETTTVNIKNIGSITKLYKLKRYDDILNNGADALFQIGNMAYVPTTTLSPIAVTLTANGTINDDLQNQNQLFELHLFEDVTPGISHIRYEIYDINNPSDLFTFTIYYNDGVTSLKDNSQASLGVSEVYPSPTINKAYITITSPDAVNKVTLSITNNLGAIVASKYIDLNAGENAIAMDIETLSPGIYFASISSSKTKIVKKFVVSK